MVRKIVELNKVNLLFDLDIYRRDSLRDLFIDYVSSPIQAIRRSPNQLHVLKDISLSISEGERIGVLGINGSGKTTLCRILTGMYKPESGKIVSSGFIRGIFDTEVGIQPELTGRENAKLLCSLLFPELKDVDTIVEEALEFSELGTFVDTPYRNYSKGMQARLCLSLVSNQPADLVILDEVFDGADKYFGNKVSKRFIELMQQSGAVLFVSHDPGQVLEICNRVIVMEHGEIIFDGNNKEGVSFYEEKVKGMESGEAYSS